MVGRGANLYRGDMVVIRWLNDWCATILGVMIFFALCAPHIQDDEGEPWTDEELKRC